MQVRQFYDDLARYYDLIFEDWDASMTRQGAAIARLLEGELGPLPGFPASARLLDAACGIGTQTLPLAARGFRAVGRDVSPAAVARLSREAAARHLSVDAGVADMRSIAASVAGRFHAVLAFDNSIPHLLTDADILTAFRQFSAVLRLGGACLCSVRDYDQLGRGVPATHPYGERTRGAEQFLLRQEWAWDDPMHYDLAFIIEREGPEGPRTVLRTETRYYAVSVDRLLALLRQAGFADCRRLDGVIYQPVLVGRRAA
jgi:SAM-dependent methyltransferase